MGTEIERKFLLTKDQYLFNKPKEGESIVQHRFYLNLSPEIRVEEIIENNISKYYLTIKGEGDLSRSETIIEIDKNKMEELIESHPYLGTHTKYCYRIGDALFSRVIFNNANEFYYAEIEFDSESEAKKYKPEFEYKKEITSSQKYKMKYFTCNDYIDISLEKISNQLSKIANNLCAVCKYFDSDEECQECKGCSKFKVSDDEAKKILFKEYF